MGVDCDRRTTFKYFEKNWKSKSQKIEKSIWHKTSDYQSELDFQELLASNASRKTFLSNQNLIDQYFMVFYLALTNKFLFGLASTTRDYKVMKFFGGSSIFKNCSQKNLCRTAVTGTRMHYLLAPNLIVLIRHCQNNLTSCVSEKIGTS